MADLFETFLNRISNMNRRERLTVAFSALSVAGLVLILIVVVQVWLPNRVVPYKNTMWNFSFEYPASWKKFDNRYGANVVVLSPKEGIMDVFQENVTVVIQDLSADPMSLKAYSELAVKQVQLLFKTGIKVIEEGPAYVAGESAYKFIYEGTDTKHPDLNLKAMHTWFIKDDRAYQINYTSLTNKYDKYLSTVEKLISSFKVK